MIATDAQEAEFRKIRELLYEIDDLDYFQKKLQRGLEKNLTEAALKIARQEVQMTSTAVNDILTELEKIDACK